MSWGCELCAGWQAQVTAGCKPVSSARRPAGPVVSTACPRVANPLTTQHHEVVTNLTIQGNRLNVITKKVTSWAAIIAVPTAITGFYGQNVPYPGFSRASGFYASTVVIILFSGFLYWLFRRKDWL